MTDLPQIRREIEAAIAIRDKATPGPWLNYGHNRTHSITAHYAPYVNKRVIAGDLDKSNGGGLGFNDAEFIAHARTDPTHAHALTLIREVEKLRAILDWYLYPDHPIGSLPEKDRKFRDKIESLTREHQ